MTFFSDIIQTEIHEKRQYYILTETEISKEKINECKLSGSNQSLSDEFVEQMITIDAPPNVYNKNEQFDSKEREYQLIKERNKYLQEKVQQLQRENERFN